MSGAAVSAADLKKQLSEIAQYAAENAPGASFADDAEAKVWESVTNHVITQVLVASQASRTEKDLRGHYTRPLRRYLQSLHSEVDAAALYPPLTPSSLDKLLQHILHAFSLPRARCALTDYCAVLKDLFRIEKYGFWLRPDRLNELITSIHTLVEKPTQDDSLPARGGLALRKENLTAAVAAMAHKPPNADAALLGAMHAMLSAYPKPLQKATLTTVFSFTLGVVKGRSADPGAQGLLLPALDTVSLLINRLHADSMLLCKGAFDEAVPMCLRTLAAHRSSEAVRLSVFALLSAGFALYDFLDLRTSQRGTSSSTTSSTTSAAFPHPPHLDELWAVSSQILAALGKVHESAHQSRHSVLLDARHRVMVEVIGRCAFCLSRKAAAAAGTAAGHLEGHPPHPDTDMLDDTAGECAEPHRLGRRKQREGDDTPLGDAKRPRHAMGCWESILQHVASPHGGVGISLRWLKVLHEFLRLQEALLHCGDTPLPPGRAALSLMDVSDGISAITSALSKNHGAVDTVQALLVEAAESLTRISASLCGSDATSHPDPTHPVSTSLASLRDHLIAKLLSSVPSSPVTLAILSCLDEMLCSGGGTPPPPAWPHPLPHLPPGRALLPQGAVESILTGCPAFSEPSLCSDEALGFILSCCRADAFRSTTPPTPHTSAEAGRSPASAAPPLRARLAAQISWVLSGVSLSGSGGGGAVGPPTPALASGVLLALLGVPLGGAALEGSLITSLEDAAEALAVGFSEEVPRSDAERIRRVEGAAGLLATLIGLAGAGVWSSGEEGGSEKGRIPATCETLLSSVTARCWRQGAGSIDARPLRAITGLFGPHLPDLSRGAFSALTASAACRPFHRSAGEASSSSAIPFAGLSGRPLGWRHPTRHAWCAGLPHPHAVLLGGGGGGGGASGSEAYPSTAAVAAALLPGLGELGRKALAAVTQGVADEAAARAAAAPAAPPSATPLEGTDLPDLMDAGGGGAAHSRRVGRAAPAPEEAVSATQGVPQADRQRRGGFSDRVAVDVELLCRAAAACTALHAGLRRGGGQAAEAEASLAPDVMHCVEGVWPAAVKTEFSFFLTGLLAAAGSREAALGCLEKAREVLSERRFKHDEYALSMCLGCIAACTDMSPESPDEPATALLSDTLEKLVEAAGGPSAPAGNKIFMSPSAKAALCHATTAVIAKAEGALLSLALEAFLPFLADHTYGVRLIAAGYVSELVGLFESPMGVFHSISEKLAPHFARSAAQGDDFGEAVGEFRAKMQAESRELAAGFNTKAQTCVYAVASIAVQCGALQATAVLQLLLVATQKGFTEHAYLDACLDSVAKSSGARTVQTLIEWHLPYLLRGWVVLKSMTFRTFPYRLLGCPQYEEFLSKYMHCILPTALQSGSRKHLARSIADAVGEDEVELLVKNLAPVFGQSYLAYYARDTVSVAKAVCEDYVKGHLSAQRLSVVLEANIFEILRTFLRLESPSQACELPSVHSAVVDRAFKDFAALWGHHENATASLLSSTPDCAYRLILDMSSELLDNRRSADWREDRFKVFQKLLRRCSPRTLSQAHVFRLSVHACICYAGTLPTGSPMSPPSLAEVADLCAHASKHAPSVLCRFLADITTRLAGLAGAAGSGGSAEHHHHHRPSLPATPGNPLSGTQPGSRGIAVAARTAAADILCGPPESLFGTDESGAEEEDEQEDAPATPRATPPAIAAILRIVQIASGSDECRKALRGTANPLPTHPSFAECNRCYDGLTGGASAGNSFSPYCEALSLPLRPLVHTAILRRLSARLRSEKCIRDDPRSATPSDLPPKVQGVLAGALRQGGPGGDALVRLLSDMSTGSGGPATRLAAAEALNQMQACLGYSWPAEAWSDTIQKVKIPAGGNWGYTEFMCEAKVSVLRCLVDAVCGPDRVEMLAAAETLKDALATPGGAQLINAADKHLRDDLVPFFPIGAKSGGPQQTLKATHTPTPALDALSEAASRAAGDVKGAALWDLASTPFPRWAGGVACGIISGTTRDPFLESCARAAVCIPEVAAALLPLALVDLAVARPAGDPKHESLQRAVAKNITRCLRGAAQHHHHHALGEAPASAARLILCGISSILALLTEDVSRAGVATTSASTEPPAASLQLSVAPGGSPVLLAKLDMLCVIDAAVACGSRATALRLAELCLERPGYAGLVVVSRQRRWAEQGRDATAAEEESDLDEILAGALGGGTGGRRGRLAGGQRPSQPPPGVVRCVPEEGYHSPHRACADDPRFRGLLMRIATSARDDDLLAGFIDGSDARYRKTLFQRAGDWGKALICADAEAQASASTTSSSSASAPPGSDLRRVLRGAGLHGVLSSMQAGGVQPAPKAGAGGASAAASAAAHALSLWDDDVASEGSFAGVVGGSLEALRSRSAPGFDAAISQGLEQIAEELGQGRHVLDRCISKLRCVHLLQSTWMLAEKSGGGGAPDDRALHRFGLHAPDMPHLGTAALTEGGGRRRCGLPVSSDSLQDVVMPCLLLPHLLDVLGRGDRASIPIHSAAKILTAAGNANAALGLIYRTRLQSATRPVPADLYVIEAELLRDQGENTAAVATMNQIASELNGVYLSHQEQGRPVHQVGPLLGSVLCTLGKWIADDTRETRSSVINNYLTPAARLVSGHDCKERPQVMFTLARFLDKLFVTLSTREAASGGKQVEEAQRRFAEASEYLQKHKGSIRKSSERAIRQTSWLLGAISTAAEEEEERITADQNAYLIQSVKAYCLASLHSDDFDLICAFRIAALWLHNVKNQELNHYLTGFFGKLARTHKYIPLAYQLVSRLSLAPAAPAGKGKAAAVQQSLFQSTLTVLVERLAREHPHHMLYHLSSLAHGAFIPETHKLSDVYIADEQKIGAAKAILAGLRKSRSVAPILRELEALVQAYLEFAFYPLDKRQAKFGQPIPIGAGLKIAQLEALRNTVVTSCDVDVSPSGDYSAAPRVQAFEKSFTTAGGINLPKIIRCLGSDGVWHKQLVKGATDDLRQDSVIEQFFTVCNSLLRAERLDNLALRTYKVVPLSPTSGVVQWVLNTLPMGEWLISRTNPKDGAHVRYHPTDLTYTEARQMLMQQGLTDEEKRSVFQEICNKFSPVMHYFFLERYRDAEEWVARRTAYIRSTAAASIVGYLIGLGDRHAQNILLDTTTGEVVHIDLGVAFERGKLLPVPELVPFRLTRDVIDGMGATGVEGPFRACCERALQVARGNKQLLHTVVEVFVYDPLCHYSVDISKVMSRQGGAAQPGMATQRRQQQAAEDPVTNADAELTLMRVSEKLDGYEDGENLSVEGQVNTLIRSASSLDTLALMYQGWAPWL